MTKILNIFLISKYTLNPQGIIYYEPILYAIIGNARKNLLTIANAMPALFSSVLRHTLTCIPASHNEALCGYKDILK